MTFYGVFYRFCFDDTNDWYYANFPKIYKKFNEHGNTYSKNREKDKMCGSYFYSLKIIIILMVNTLGGVDFRFFRRFLGALYLTSLGPNWKYMLKRFTSFKSSIFPLSEYIRFLYFKLKMMLKIQIEKTMFSEKANKISNHLFCFRG